MVLARRGGHGMSSPAPQAHTQTACPRCASLCWGLVLQDGDWVCSQCERLIYRSMLAIFLATQRESAPATKKQVAFIRALGLPVQKNLTLPQATDLIIRAQNARFYAWKVARQAWGREMSGRELRPILNAVLSRPQLSGEIARLIDQHLQAVVEALDASPEQASAAAPQFAPGLPEDASFTFIRDELVRHYPALRKPASPAPEASRIEITREKEVLQQIGRELHPQYFISQEPLWNRVKPFVRAGAALVLIGLLVHWSRPVREAANDSALEPVKANQAEVLGSVTPIQKPGALPRPLPPMPAGPPALPAPKTQPQPREWDEPPNPNPIPAPIPQPIPVAQPVVAPEEPVVVSAEDLALQADAEKAFREFKLPTGLTLRETLAAIRTAAAPKGYFFWEGKAGPVRDGSAQRALRIEWAVSWKSEGQNWTRLQAQWTVNEKTGALAPSNPDAHTFAKLQETLAK